MEPTNRTMDLPAMVVQRCLGRRSNGGERCRDEEQWRGRGAILKVRGSKFVLTLPKLSEAPKERIEKCWCDTNLKVGGQWL
jgi:hypothetical protein